MTVLTITRDQAEAIIVDQRTDEHLALAVTVMGWADWYDDEDLLELNDDQLEDIQAGEYQRLELWVGTV